MRFPVSAIVLSLYAALAASSPIPEPDTSDIDLSKIYVEGIAHAGSGCPSESVAFTHNSDWTVFTLVFERFSVSIGPGIPSAQRSKNCIVEARLRYPPGYQYTIYQADFRDQATLDKGVNATHQVSFWFAGETPKATLKAQWIGPLSGSYDFHGILANEALAWSPCSASAALNISSEISLDNSMNSQGSGNNFEDGLDFPTRTICSIRWRKCL